MRPLYVEIYATIGPDTLPAHHIGPAVERLRRATHDALNAAEPGTRWAVCGLRSAGAVDLLAWFDGGRFAYSVAFLEQETDVPGATLAALSALAGHAGPWSAATGVSTASIMAARGGPAALGALLALGLVCELGAAGELMRVGFTPSGAALADLLGVPVPASAAENGGFVQDLETLAAIQSVAVRGASYDRLYTDMMTGEHGGAYADTPAPPAGAVPDLSGLVDDYIPADTGPRFVTLDELLINPRPARRSGRSGASVVPSAPVEARTLGRFLLDALAALGGRLGGSHSRTKGGF